MTPSRTEPLVRSHDIGRWVFTLGEHADAWAKGFDDSGWRPVVVPHDWSVEQEFSQECSSGTGYLPGGIGWYRAHVRVGDLGPTSGRHAEIVFHGVYKNARVWVNGYHLGGRPSGYARFSFDLTEILSYAPDDDLVVAVRVEHTDLSDSRWYNGAGITRQVEIQVHEPVRLAEGTAFTTETADPTQAAVRVQQVVANDLDDDVRVQVHHELLALTSGTTHVVQTEADVPARGTAALDVRTTVGSPDLWSDVAPGLYRLTTTLSWPRGSGRGQADYTDVVGIRTFAFDPDTGFSINGEPRVLKGVCLHEDAGCLGNAVPAGVWLRRLLKLKAMGCNAVRMAHNPHAPELYLLCDALGLFVIDEAFDEWENPKNKWWQGHNVYPPRHQGYAKDFPDWHERDLVAMIDAHRNHPSVIAWSIGNEIDYPNDPYASRLFDEMTGNNDANKPVAERVYDPRRPDMRRLTGISRRLGEIVRRRDGYRPVTVGAAFPEASSRTGLLETLDLVGYNYKEHLYAEDHLRFPDKPLLGSENSHTYEAWRYVADNDYVAGQFLWTGIDYLGEARGWPVHGSPAGLLTVAGFEKHAWHLRRSWWSQDPVAYLATRPIGPEEGDGAARPFWTYPLTRAWGVAAGERTEVLCFSNGEEVTLTCGGEELPLRRDDEHGYWVAVVPATDAPLALQAWRGGAVVARDELSPGRPAVRIEASAWAAPPEAARAVEAVGLEIEDVAQVECVLRDEHGGVAAGDVVVTADVEGGDLLGLESGDLADNTPYSSTSRSTFDGRLVVFVRCSQRTIVRLSAPGLEQVTIECRPGER
jgi:beta-galactosidase